MYSENNLSVSVGPSADWKELSVVKAELLQQQIYAAIDFKSMTSCFCKLMIESISTWRRDHFSLQVNISSFCTAGTALPCSVE